MRVDGTRRGRYRRPRVLPVTLCVCAQAHPVVAQDGHDGAFASQLARRLAGVHPDALEALALERPAWRAEPCWTCRAT
jgi:hypothetical protein